MSLIFTPFPWKNKPSKETPLSKEKLNEAEELIAAFALTASAQGLASPLVTPYNAKCDGVTDDTEAFKKLHEAINAGTIKGYILPATAKITAELPTIKASNTQIRFIAGAVLDFSSMVNANATSALNIRGTIGAAAVLTEDAGVGALELGCNTAYADGTLLKITDTVTQWDSSQKALVGEIVEVGRPDGALSGYNGKVSEAAGMPAGTKLTEIVMTSLNPVNVVGETPTMIIPASGEVELGTQKFKYESWTVAQDKVKFKLEGEQEDIALHKQGDRMIVMAPAGKVLLRTPVTHELGFTVANASQVKPITQVDDVILDNINIRGAKAEARLCGIDLRYCRNAEVRHPIVRDCWTTGIRFNDCIDSHIDDPLVENAREVEYAGGGLQGYGINFSFATQDCSVRGGRTFRTRHSFTMGGSSAPGENGGLPRRNVIMDHTAVATFADAFDSHGGVYSVELVRCTSINSTSTGFNFNCPKVTMTACRAVRPAGAGMTLKNLTLGRTEYDMDIHMIEPRASNAYGLKFGQEGATYGLTVGFVKIRGFFDTCPATAVELTASSATIRNVDIDIIVRGGITRSEACVVKAEKSDNVRVRVQASGVEKARNVVKLKEVSDFLVDLGPVEWTAESSANRGVLVEGASVGGVIREGPMKNLGTGKSTELKEAGVEKVDVYLGPAGALANTGTNCRKVTPA